MLVCSRTWSIVREYIRSRTLSIRIEEEKTVPNTPDTIPSYNQNIVISHQNTQMVLNVEGLEVVT